MTFEWRGLSSLDILGILRRGNQSKSEGQIKQGDKQMGGKLWQGPLEKIDDYRWRIPKSYKQGMRVPGIIYASEKLMKDIRNDQALEQVANVAVLPGVVNYSLGMPDIHWGYGFPIGGVAATDIDEGGVISPGGVGYDQLRREISQY